MLVQLFALMYCNVKAENTVSEIAYLQTDRTAYIAGEPIFYKLYVLDEATKMSSNLSKVGYILLRNIHSNVVLKIRVNIQAGMANGSIALPDTLTTGMYQMVAFTSTMRNKGDNRFFHKEISIANRFDKALNLKFIPSTLQDIILSETNSNIEIKTDKSTYNTREKVTVSLGRLNSKANVSISVFEEPKVPTAYKSIVQTFNDSTNVRKDSRIETYYSPETKGKLLRGSVVDAKTNQTIKGAVVILSCIDSVPNLEYAVTNARGVFQILLTDYYNGKELFLTIKDIPENSSWKILVEDNFAQSEKWKPALISANKSDKEFIVKSQNIVYINKVYQLDKNADKRQLIKSELICPRFHNSPVTTILPSDFVPLDSFPEIAVEILPQVRVIKEKGKYHVQMIDELMKGYQKHDPAIFLDGAYVDDVNKIIPLKSDQISKIELTTAERAFGDLVFSGAIFITSATNEMMNTKPASHSFRIKNDNINPGENAVPANPKPDINTPYIRQLLYWNPDLGISKTEEVLFDFYTSDNQARFIIKVEGVTEDGMPVSASSSIKVENQINITDK